MIFTQSDWPFWLISFIDLSLRRRHDHVWIRHVSIDDYIHKVLRNSSIAVVVQQKQPVAYCLFYDNDIGRDFSFVSYIYVNSSFRASGFGSQLLESVEKHVLNNGIGQMLLEVDVRNSGAVEFYLRRGYCLRSIDDAKLSLNKIL